MIRWLLLLSLLVKNSFVLRVCGTPPTGCMDLWLFEDHQSCAEFLNRMGGEWGDSKQHVVFRRCVTVELEKQETP